MRPAGTSAAKLTQPGAEAARSFSSTSATSGASATSAGSGGSSSALPKVSVRSQRAIARASEPTSLGAVRRTAGSLEASIRSVSSCAVVSMLRRSWLIFATAAPRPARRSFWRSAEVSCTSSSCSAVSASRSSRAPLSGAMIRLASIGSSR